MSMAATNFNLRRLLGTLARRRTAIEHGRLFKRRHSLPQLMKKNGYEIKWE